MQAVLSLLPTIGTEPEEELMAIRNEDWDAIHRTINQSIETAVSKLQPRGWRKALYLCREWGVLGTAATLIVALVAIAAAAWYQAFARLEKETASQTKTESRLTEIEASLGKIKDSLGLSALKQLINNPIDSDSAKKIAGLVNFARTPENRLDEKVVSQVGEKLISDSKNDNDSWKAALSLLGYKSFLNTFLPSVPTTPNPKEELHTKYNFTWWSGTQPPRFFVFGVAPLEQAAQLQKIGEPLTTDKNEGNSFILVDGGAVLIDGYQFKNVIFRNARITYHGGPLVMENVYFLNCTFDIPQQNNGQQLATALLKRSAAITFKAS
jgi:hypothetical protein